MNHSFVFVLLFTCFSFEFCDCFAFCCFFFNIMFLFCVFVLCAFLYFRFGIQRCVSVSYSRVSVLGLGFPFWLALDQQNNNGLYVHHAFCTFHCLHCTITT